MLTTDFENKLSNLYGEYMGKMSISLKEGLLGSIENNRYKDDVLRFSGFPYIGAEYHTAKKKILFVGLDIGIDELRYNNTYHSIKSNQGESVLQEVKSAVSAMLITIPILLVLIQLHYILLKNIMVGMMHGQNY